MKKYILLSVSLLALSAGAFAQNFSFAKDTVYMTIGGKENVHNDIQNIGSSPLKVTWQVTASDFPASWIKDDVFGICDNQLCRMGVDMTKTYTTMDIAAGQAADFHLQMDLTNSTDFGMHYMTVTFSDGVNPAKKSTFAVNKFPTNVSSINKTNESITIYPNPAKSDLNVLFDGNAGIKNISVYNLIGKAVSVYKVSGNSAKLDLDNIPSGIYLLRFVDGQGRILATRKFTHQ